MKKLMLFILISVLISSCTSSPRESDIQTAIAETNAEIPTFTYTFTFIPTSTDTLTPTNTSTSTKTSTPTKTMTPTNTNTATPLPPATLTQQVVEATQTERAENAKSTQDTKNKNYTATASIRTKTAQSYNRTATAIASYEEIYWKELVNYPDNYIGQKVVVRGRVFNIGDDYIQIWIAGTYEALIAVFKEKIAGIYEDDSITVYGIVSGERCGTNAFGGEVCQPALKDAWYTKP